MNTNDEYKLSHQQQRFCDEYLVHFNAFKAAINAGYSDNTARKGELLHLPKVQYYLQDAMRKTQSRLQITHDMILAELAKVAFSNMGNYYDEYAVLKPMNQLTNDEKAAISYYQIMDALDDRGQRIGELSKIKLHNKMAALDKIARHLGFYVASPKSESPEVRKTEEKPKADVGKLRAEDESELLVVSSETLSPEPEALGPELVNGKANKIFENILTLSPLPRSGSSSEEWQKFAFLGPADPLGRIGVDAGLVAVMG